MGRGKKVRPCFSCDHGTWALPVTLQGGLTGCSPSQTKSTLATLSQSTPSNEARHALTGSTVTQSKPSPEAQGVVPMGRVAGSHSSGHQHSATVSSCEDPVA